MNNPSNVLVLPPNFIVNKDNKIVFNDENVSGSKNSSGTIAIDIAFLPDNELEKLLAVYFNKSFAEKHNSFMADLSHFLHMTVIHTIIDPNDLPKIAKILDSINKSPILAITLYLYFNYIHKRSYDLEALYCSSDYAELLSYLSEVSLMNSNTVSVPFSFLSGGPDWGKTLTLPFIGITNEKPLVFADLLPSLLSLAKISIVSEDPHSTTNSNSDDDKSSNGLNPNDNLCGYSTETTVIKHFNHSLDNILTNKPFFRDMVSLVQKDLSSGVLLRLYHDCLCYTLSHYRRIPFVPSVPSVDRTDPLTLEKRSSVLSKTIPYKTDFRDLLSPDTSCVNESVGVSGHGCTTTRNDGGNGGGNYDTGDGCTTSSTRNGGGNYVMGDLLIDSQTDVEQGAWYTNAEPHSVKYIEMSKGVDIDQVKVFHSHTNHTSTLNQSTDSDDVGSLINVIQPHSDTGSNVEYVIPRTMQYSACFDAIGQGDRYNPHITLGSCTKGIANDLLIKQQNTMIQDIIDKTYNYPEIDEHSLIAHTLHNTAINSEGKIDLLIPLNMPLNTTVIFQLGDSGACRFPMYTSKVNF